MLQAKDFDEHPDWAEAAFALIDEDHTVDQTTLEHKVGRALPESIISRDPPPENAESFAEEILYAARKRRAIETLAELAVKAQNGHSPDELTQMTEEAAVQLGSDRGTSKINKAGQYVPQALEEMEEEEESLVTGIPTPLHELNKLLRGFQDGHLIYIAGRPSMGKTSLALQCAKHAAEQDFSIGYISAEQRPQPLTVRLIKQEAQVSERMMKTKDNPEKWKRLNQAAEKIYDLDLYLTEQTGMDIFKLKTLIRKLKIQHECDMVFFDYFQLLNSPPDASERKSEWMGDASRQLKEEAKRMEIPLGIVSQLNRSVENRGGAKRPQLSDLREAGQMEEDADVVMFVYRAERYGITVDANGNSTEGVAEIIVEKNRNRSVGTARVAFREAATRFEDLSRRDDEPGRGSSPYGPSEDPGF
jgi:replicative DNA helicase